MVGMLVLGGGGGMGWLLSQSCWWKWTLLKLGPLHKGSGGPALAQGHISVLARCRKGSRGSALARGLLSEPTLHHKGFGRSLRVWVFFLGIGRCRKGSGGSALARGHHSGFDSRLNGPGGPAHICVLSEVVGGTHWGTGRLSCSLLL